MIPDNCIVCNVGKGRSDERLDTVGVELAGVNSGIESQQIVEEVFAISTGTEQSSGWMDL